MLKVVMAKSTVTGIHRTKVSSCEEVVLQVVKDDSIPGVNPYCTKVMFPSSVANNIMDLVTWPKNAAYKRHQDQLLRDCVGRKVSNVPVNLIRLFPRCLQYCPN